MEVTPVSFDELSSYDRPTEHSVNIRKRVTVARKIQHRRFHKWRNIYANAQMPTSLLQEVCRLDKASTLLLKTAMNKLQLSARAYDRILKVARTCADLNASEHIKAEHIAEAIQFRSLDRENWSG